jgi:hypothetical protein
VTSAFSGLGGLRSTFSSVAPAPAPTPSSTTSSALDRAASAAAIFARALAAPAYPTAFDELDASARDCDRAALAQSLSPAELQDLPVRCRRVGAGARAGATAGAGASTPVRLADENDALNPFASPEPALGSPTPRRGAAARSGKGAPASVQLSMLSPPKPLGQSRVAGSALKR